MKNELEILRLYIKNFFYEETIRGIALELKKPYPKIHEAIKNLEKKQILNTKKIGNSIVCALNLSPIAMNEIAHLEEKEAFSRDIKNIDTILSFEDLYEDIIIVTGSYAQKKETAKSDLDLVIITDEIKKKKLIENKTLTLKPEVHVIVFTGKDFVDMLLSKEGNIGKEVFRKKLIFRGAERYYYLIKEAMRNGFNSKNLS